MFMEEDKYYIQHNTTYNNKSHAMRYENLPTYNCTTTTFR